LTRNWEQIYSLKSELSSEITVKNIQAYMERTVTKFGSGAKVDCPKEFLGKKAFLIIKKDED